MGHEFFLLSTSALLLAAIFLGVHLLWDSCQFTLSTSLSQKIIKNDFSFRGKHSVASPKSNSRRSLAKPAPSSRSGLSMTERLDAQRDSDSVSSEMWTQPRQP